MSKLFKKYSAIVLICLGVVVGILLAIILWYKLYLIYTEKNLISEDSYQAIFLSNDQIYFGHLKNINSDYLLLEDVYYVKIDGDSGGKLIKLGQSEPHRPTNEMMINKDQVLFWENLSPDSPVVQTIRSVR